jgi:hypothetical protein
MAGPAGNALIPSRQGLELLNLSARPMPAKPQVLSSKWTGLSKHLLATIFPVSADGSPDTGPEVVAPPTDATLEATAGWQSPFEGSGPEARAPAIMAMLQSGAPQSYVQSLAKLQGSGPVSDFIADLVKSGAAAVTAFSKSAQGRSGMTKLNSTQVFIGAPPVKLPMTLHFRAFDNPAAEVRAPVDQLWAWFLARKLAPDGAIVSAGKALSSGDVVSALMPSEAPQMVGFRFGGFTFAPMVIESLSQPLTVSRGTDGEALHVAVNITLATLTALDADDWRRAREGKPTLLFNNVR